ncbi:MAG: polysulfide reductase NrfD, partial [Abitibacteriaceae bacterium]|nr:polysulfide reductase NrfD [Abditibacteriaceae bacterium]
MPGDTDNRRQSPDEQAGKGGKNSADSSGQEASYYDVPMLKPPVWQWEIATYFFLGGLASGAYILGRLAERFGGEDYREITRAGTAIAAVAAIPCSPLLIKDLGDPKRFHHMLRVFKPKSPMNLGSWVLTACSALIGLATVREVLDSKQEDLPTEAVRVADGAINISDIVGLPLMLLLGSYTGILLSATATPVWSRNRWLGPLFISSAMSTGAAAISLALEATSEAKSPAKDALQKVETTARVVEGAMLSGYLVSCGELNEPLTKGKFAPHLWGGTVGGGFMLPELLERLPVGGKVRRWIKIIADMSTLLGGLALR